MVISNCITLLGTLALHVHALDMIDFPGSISSVIVDLGANQDPVIPPPHDEAVAVIAVEPLVGLAQKMIERNIPRLYVIAAAIGSKTGLGLLHKYGQDGRMVSSSLSPATDHGALVAQGSAIVPVITLKQLLDAIPPRISIQHLKTDLQGHDLNAVLSAGNAIRRLQCIISEVAFDGVAYMSHGIEPNTIQNWRAAMANHGFDYISEGTGIRFKWGREADVLWRRDDLDSCPMSKKSHSGSAAARMTAPKAITLTVVVDGAGSSETLTFKQGDDTVPVATTFCQRHADPATIDICMSQVISYATNPDAGS